MQKKQKIGSRPAYFDGQLLQAEDFIAEQQYHRQAHRLHNQALHGWGVVSGLEVRPSSEHQITVQGGFAVDVNGREIALAQVCTLDLTGMPPRTRLRVTIAYRSEPENQRSHRNRIDSHAVVAVGDDPDDKDALLLATLQLDAGGKLDAGSIDHSTARRARTRLLPGSVDTTSLDDSLRRGWMAMALRSMPLERGPDGVTPLPPPFRIGTTEARSFDKWEDADNIRGAGGTMSIPIPFGARHLLSFRVAGVDNAEQLDVHIVRGGFDPTARQHSRAVLLKKTVKGAPYNEVWSLEDGGIDPAYHTLSLWMHAHGHISVSLVAFEFSY